MNEPSLVSGRIVGYARVSTVAQDEALQVDALQAAGVRRRDIYVDHGVSGSTASRPELNRMLFDVEPGDVVVVWKLDRLGRSSGHVLVLLDDLIKRGVHLRTLDGIDTTTTTGRAMLAMLAVFAEMERSFIRERTVAGLAAARAKGRTGGRPVKLDAEGVRYARELVSKGESMSSVAARLRVGRATLYRALSR
jgi:DNA invertase Pin-like site-specific DNA recombinase